MRDPMKAESLEAERFDEVIGQRVSHRFRWAVGMKRRVENGDVRYLWIELARLTNRGERGPVVQRGQGHERFELGLDFCRNSRRLDESGASVHDPVAECVGRFSEPLESRLQQLH